MLPFVYRISAPVTGSPSHFTKKVFRDLIPEEHPAGKAYPSRVGQWIKSISRGILFRRKTSPAGAEIDRAVELFRRAAL